MRSPHVFHFLQHFQRTQFTSSLLSISLPKSCRNASTFHQNTTTQNSQLYYLQCLSTLIKTLIENPRNYNALIQLDTILSQPQFLTSSVSLISIDYLTQINKLQRAKTLLLRLRTKGRVSNFFLYSLIFDFLVKDYNNINGVDILWHEICGSELGTIDVSDYVIHVCKYGCLDEIKNVCERVLKGGKVLRKQSYVALIGALCRFNEGLLAKDVVNEMNYKGFSVDDLSYFEMFQCFCRIGNVIEADLILRKLVERKFNVDVNVYRDFIYALCKSGKTKEANKLFHKLVKTEAFRGFKKVEDLKEGRRVIFQLNWEGNVPEMMAYEAYFTSLCSVGKLDDAEMLLKKMMKKRKIPKVSVYGSFILALCKVSRYEDALKFFNVERKRGIVRLEDIAGFMIMGLCGGGRVDDAMDIFNTWFRDTVSVDPAKDTVPYRSRCTGTVSGYTQLTSFGASACTNVCNCIVNSYWRAGRVAEAESFFRKLQDCSYEKPDVVTYMIMVSGYCKQGDVSKALHLFEEMRSRSIPVNGRLYEMIIRGLCACGRVEDALAYFSDMIENGFLVSAKRWKLILHSFPLGG